jgi:2-polyprenyl-6-methoxyphenol hydroxylase-like FAD-dependent oxidoreductase
LTPEVLVVGAGPTGLVLALWLTRLGVAVRIVDKAAEPGTTSRALAVQARTLEHYQQLGLADAVAAQGLQLGAVNMWVGGRKVARAAFADMGAGLSPFPYALIYPQDEHERALIARLGTHGVTVERSVEMVGFGAGADRVSARLRRADGTVETCTVAYLAGCDGASSDVRDALGVGFPGGTYEHLFYVADLEASGPPVNRELNAALDQADFLALFPLKREGHVRIVGTVRADAAQRRDGLSWDDVSTDLIRRLRIQVTRVNWFSTYHVHHRVAQRFRAGRVFLLGDAAHIHSPVGGQGMNTGIGDAVNLAWKLAAVLRGDVAGSLLDTYEPERIAFARRLVATTDRAFTLVTSRGPVARRVRVGVVPLLFPLLVRFARVRRLMFRTISQTVIEYRASRLSAGVAGRVHGGDRLPWVRAADNFAPLTSLTWQVHVYGAPAPALAQACRDRGLALHAFPWRAEMAAAGLARNALYLVRPDGYVALADAAARPDALASYLDTRGIRRLPLARASTSGPVSSPATG